MQDRDGSCRHEVMVVYPESTVSLKRLLLVHHADLLPWVRSGRVDVTSNSWLASCRRVVHDSVAIASIISPSPSTRSC